MIEAPIVVLSSTHSGGRVIARLLEEFGVRQPQKHGDTYESTPIMRAMEKALECYYLHYTWGKFWRYVDEQLDEAFALTGGRKKPYCIKDARSLSLLPFLEKRLPDAVYLHITRDGRDFAINRVIQRGAYPWFSDVHCDTPNALYSAQYWARTNTFAADYCEFMLAEPRRYARVKLEDICANPRHCVKDLARYLGYGGDLSRCGRWIETPNTIGRYKEHALRGDIEQLIGTELERFGYRLDD